MEHFIFREGLTLSNNGTVHKGEWLPWEEKNKELMYSFLRDCNNGN